MNSLKSFSKNWKKPSPKKIAIIGLVISIIGFTDASYLSILHLSNSTPSCSLIHGCEVVLTSQYSEVAGIPISGLGAGFYLSIAFLLYSFLYSKKTKYISLASCIAPFGFLASIWLVFVMAFILKAYCQYCLLSALSSTLIFLLLLPNTKKQLLSIKWQRLRK